MDGRCTDVIRAAVARLNASDADGYLAAFQSECVHWIAGINEPMAMPAFVESLQALRTGLPDLRLEEISLFAVGNFVCAQWRTRGTHAADLFGFAPTRRAISFDTAEVYELDAAGRICVSWAFGDPDVLFSQLGDGAGQERP